MRQIELFDRHALPLMQHVCRLYGGDRAAVTVLTFLCYCAHDGLRIAARTRPAVTLQATAAKGKSGPVTDRESHWAALMRAATRGDASAYHRLLDELAPMLRGLASRGFAHHKLSPEDVEDVVQETLLALHLKRHT